VCDARALVAHALERQDADLRGDVWLLAAGKAATGMASAALSVIGDRIRGGLVVAPESSVWTSDHGSIEFVAGGHPIPTPASEAAGRRALTLAQRTAPADALLVLLSGGASALMAVPVAPLTLEDKRLTTERLLRNGATIDALNTVRKHLSAIKGGQLAAATPARCRTLAISDVVGDSLSVIASGPTVADTSTFGDAWSVLTQYGGVAGCPPRVEAHIRRGLDGDLVETPKLNDPRLSRAEATVIGGRHTAMTGAADEARRLGFAVETVRAAIVGDARQAAAAHAHNIRERIRQNAGRPLCIVSSGETTVHVKGTGRGGRNQEFALALSESMRGFQGQWLAASVGTDGVDGPTDAAGGIVDSETPSRAAAANLFPARTFLDTNNSYAYFAAIGDLIQTGPTGTNVGDLQVVLVM
jgi:hydroxypyruvate reductase